MPNIRENYLEVRRSIDRTCAAAGRTPGAVQLLAVSKFWPAGTVQQVVDCGQRLFGESRLQEAEEKIPALPAGLEWHFIGHIQKNKVRRILGWFTTLHGVDSLGLARRIDQVAAELALRPRIFLEVNIAGEASKHGFSPQELREQIGEILALGHVEVRGLMAIPPAVDEAEASRPHFRAVRELQEELADATSHSFPELSMGMSDDYQVAIEEGATIVRVGSSIFGARA